MLAETRVSSLSTRSGNLVHFTVTPALSREEWEATLATVPDDAPLCHGPGRQQC
jgi:hypothetical protein